ncbi:lipopolysaccharide biosynthesis protein [Faustovirus]|nr:lipopolysaccharide biosynthesis protein [Faustovirus]
MASYVNTLYHTWPSLIFYGRKIEFIPLIFGIDKHLFTITHLLSTDKMDIASIEKIFEEAYEAKLKEVEAEYQYKISTLEKQLKSLSLAQSTNPFEESANIEAKKRADDLQKQLDAVIAERDTVELKRKGVWKKYDNLAAQMEGLRENHKKERDGLTAKITELARKLNDADDLDSIKAKEENLNLKQLCDIKDQEIAQWKRKTTDITMILDSGKKMYEELNAKHQELNTKHKELNGKHRELNGKYTEINGKYAELDNKYNTLVDKWNKLVVSNKATCEELACLKLKVMQTPPMPPLRPPTNVYQQSPMLPPMVAPVYNIPQGRMVPPLNVVPQTTITTQDGITITTTIDNEKKNCVLMMSNMAVLQYMENIFKRHESMFNQTPKHCIKLYERNGTRVLLFRYLDGQHAETERSYQLDIDCHIISKSQFVVGKNVEFEPNAAELAIVYAVFHREKTPGYVPITNSTIVIAGSFDTAWMNL